MLSPLEVARCSISAEAASLNTSFSPMRTGQTPSGCGSGHGSLYVVYQGPGLGGFLHAVPSPITGLPRGCRFGLGSLMNETSESRQSDSGFKAVLSAQDDCLAPRPASSPEGKAGDPGPAQPGFRGWRPGPSGYLAVTPGVPGGRGAAPE